ncbi:MAG: hypothetical protein P8Y60_17165 [Calditrichota bacterium]
MITRLTAAYTRFSRQMHRTYTSSLSELVRPRATETAREQSQPTRSDRNLQEKQLEDLRSTGTLKNLETILNEDEKSLLRKLFPDKVRSYSQDGQLVTNTQPNDKGKGKSLDTRM